MVHQKHEEWFDKWDKSKVLIIDTTEDFKNNGTKID